MSKVTSIMTASAIALTLAFGSTAAFAGPRDTPVRACAVKAMPSSVVIKVQTLTEDKDGNPVKGISTGSGSVIDWHGIVITNQHVIENGTAIKVQLAGQDGKWRTAKVIYSDKATDLAALMIATDDNEKLPEMEFGPSSDLAVGEPAIVIGSPFGDAFSLSSGVISKLAVPKPGSDDDDNTGGIFLIQTDASVNPGNSGGMLLNADCEQVGVVELKLGPAGIGFAITSDRTARWLAANLSADKVGIYHGILGVSTKVVAEDGPDRETVIVKQMAVGSPAAQVLQLGDTILSIDGKHVSNGWDLERFLAFHDAGDDVKLQVVRDGKTIEVVLKLAAAPKAVVTKD